MLEMHLRKSTFTCSACGSFTRKKERNRKYIYFYISRYIYQIEFDKARFQHDVACEILSICLE